MLSTLANGESGENVILSVFLLVLFIIFLNLSIHRTPALIEDGTSSSLKVNASGCCQHCCLGILTVGIEHGTEPT